MRASQPMSVGRTIAKNPAGGRGRGTLLRRPRSSGEFSAEGHMLRWAVVFLILGLVAGVLGFTAIAGASIAIAKFLFFLFIAIFLVLLILGFTAARRITGR